MVFFVSTDIKEVLNLFGFSDQASLPKMKDVVKTYHKMALKSHPDKPGGSTEEFQKLQEAFIKIGSYISSQHQFVNADRQTFNSNDADVEENIARNIFKQFYLNGRLFSFRKKFLHTGKTDLSHKVLPNKKQNTLFIGCHKRFSR